MIRKKLRCVYKNGRRDVSVFKKNNFKKGIENMIESDLWDQERGDTIP